MLEVFGPLLNARAPCGNLWMSVFSFSLNPNTIRPGPLENICMGEKCVWALLLVHVLMFVLSFEEVIESLTSLRENKNVFGLGLRLYLMAIHSTNNLFYVPMFLKIQTCVCWLAHLCFTLLVAGILLFKLKMAPFIQLGTSIEGHIQITLTLVLCWKPFP